MKKVIVLGGLGNMGRRYCAILRHIGANPIPLDVKDESILRLEKEADGASGIIIATPTSQHVADILDFIGLGLPILVEKPISKLMSRVEHCCSTAQKNNVKLEMVNQYKGMVDANDSGLTCYNYWNHGRDGLVWDCISVVALAKGNIELAETSPIWTCIVNGFRLDQAKMDYAYVGMIMRWLAEPKFDPEYIISAHEKVHEYVRNHE